MRVKIKDNAAIIYMEKSPRFYRSDRMRKLEEMEGKTFDVDLSWIRDNEFLLSNGEKIETMYCSNIFDDERSYLKACDDCAEAVTKNVEVCPKCGANEFHDFNIQTVTAMKKMIIDSILKESRTK